ncbi:MAG: glycosyltransferase family 4 protein [Candidatus Aminicenantes bacterium]|nr:glycosyltransferase family 4 protein [Candidatus Aminicenantes bacterium]
MKIALLTPFFSPYNGIDRVVERQARDLTELGHAVTIYCFRARLRTAWANVVEIGTPHPLILDRLYRLFFFLNRRTIKRLLQELQGFDRIVCHHYPMTVLGHLAKKTLGKTYVYYDHGISPAKLFPSIVDKTYQTLVRRWTIKTVRNADEAISVSSFLSGILAAETGLKSLVEYNKIDGSRFKKGISGEAIRTRHGFGQDPVCLFVGRVSPHKGVHRLIEAFGEVVKTVPEAKLLIAGAETFPRYARKLKRRARSVGPRAILFAGFVPDKELPLYYGAADLYVTASLWEGFDLPMAEAAACGKPAVAFDAGAHPEVIREGRLVDTDEEFAVAVVEYLRGGRR